MSTNPNIENSSVDPTNGLSVLGAAARASSSGGEAALAARNNGSNGTFFTRTRGMMPYSLLCQAIVNNHCLFSILSAGNASNSQESGGGATATTTTTTTKVNQIEGATLADVHVTAEATNEVKKGTKQYTKLQKI